MPRAKGDVWSYFIASGGNKYKCMFCDMEYKKHVTRMTYHLKRCKRCPVSVTRKLFTESGRKDVGKYKKTNSGLF